MNPRYALVAARAGQRCEYCHAPEVIFNFPFEVEHIVPPGRAGSDTEDNWALACRSCNLHKSDGLEGIDPETGATTRLLHPRRDDWDEHCEVQIESGIIVGRTPIGRATIMRLRMNLTTPG